MFINTVQNLENIGPILFELQITEQVKIPPMCDRRDELLNLFLPLMTLVKTFIKIFLCIVFYVKLSASVCKYQAKLKKSETCMSNHTDLTM